MPIRLFADRETGQLIRIERTDDTYVQIRVLSFPLTSHFNMARSDYDTVFVERYRPATEEDIRRSEVGEIEMPANAPDDWRV